MEQLMKPKRVAELADVAENTVYRAIRAGELAAVKVGGSVRVPESAARAWLKPVGARPKSPDS